MLFLDPVLLVNAITYANIIALMSVGVTTTYMTTKVPNFAQGAFVGVGIYVTLTVDRLWKLGLYSSVPFAFVIGGIVGVLMYRFAIRPPMKRAAPVIILMIATLAVDTLFVGVLNIYADYLQGTFRVISRGFELKSDDFAVGGIPGVFIITSIVIAVSIVALRLFVTRTKFGIALRATVEDPSLAGTMGISVERVYIVSWFISGALLCMAGAFLPAWLLSSTDTGDNSLVIVFAGCALGGIYSMFGTFVGAWILGIAEVMITFYAATFINPAATAFQPVIPLIVMVAAILWLPSGLGSIRLRERLRR